MYSETKDFFIEHSQANLKMPSMHYHSTYELYYLEAGQREYFVEDKFFKVNSGDFVLIAPYKLHRTGGSFAKRTIVGFSEEYLKKTFSEEAVKKILSAFQKTIVSPSPEEHASLIDKLRIIEKSEDETITALTLANLLVKLSECKSEETIDERISRVIEYINKNFSEIESIEQIANHFYVSKYHLCRTFKSAMKLTVIDYLNGVKIKNACHYLKTTNKSITEIALLTGFNSSTYFTSVFKNTMKKRPSAYRKEG